MTCELLRDLVLLITCGFVHLGEACSQAPFMSYEEVLELLIVSHYFECLSKFSRVFLVFCITAVQLPSFFLYTVQYMVFALSHIIFFKNPHHGLLNLFLRSRSIIIRFLLVSKGPTDQASLFEYTSNEFFEIYLGLLVSSGGLTVHFLLHLAVGQVFTPVDVLGNFIIFLLFFCFE